MAEAPVIVQTTDYFVFDSFDPTSLAGWRLNLAHGYHALTPNDRGWLWCETLKLWLGTWKGVIDQEPASGSCTWLRFYTPQGDLVLLPEEAAQPHHVTPQSASIASAVSAQAGNVGDATTLSPTKTVSS